MKKILSIILLLILMCFVSINVFGLTIEETVKGAVVEAEKELKSFSDVPRTHWAHSAIMQMAQRGMIAGTTTPDANGVSTFAPNATMTRAQFVTVVTRYLYADEIKNYAGMEGVWYAANYNVAIDNGLIKETEFTIDEMNKPMTRQEMAMVLVRAMNELGEDKGTLISTSKIPDYNSIGRVFRKDHITGEMLSMGDWNKLRGELNPNGKFAGDYDGEIINTWYKWNSAAGLWSWIGPSK